MRVGTIGTGFIVEWLIDAMLDNNIQVEACFSRKQETGEKLANKYGIKKVYTDYNDMLKDENIDFIYIASPNSLHYNYAKLALENGKNVISEKPFFSNVKECQEMIDLARSKNLMLFEAITCAHNPNIKEIKNILNKLGRIKIVQANMSQYSRKYDQFLNNEHPNVFTTKFSGGALMDINVYNIHFVMTLFGKPNEVRYDANIKEGIDTSGCVSLKYNDFVCDLVGSKDNIGYNFAQIQGENGYIITHSASSLTTSVDYKLRNKEEGHFDLTQGKGGHYWEINAMKEIYENKDYDACYKLLDYSLEVMKVLDLCRNSSGIVFEADQK